MTAVNKSTNVRSAKTPRPVHALRWLAAASPELGSIAATRLFLRAPSRRSRSLAERAALAAAEPFTVSTRTAELRAWRWGHGPVVLLAHGWGGTGGQLRPFVAPLVAAGFSVVAFDAPGHGSSSGSSASLPAFAAAIAAVAAHVGPVHAVVAHSMGGAATSLAVADGLEIGRAVFLGPPADAQSWLDAFNRFVGLAPRAAELTRSRVERAVGVAFERLNAAVLGPAMRVPLLVVHDRDDAEVPWSDGAAVAAASPDARLLSTDGLGHRRILHDRAVIDAVIGFVAAAPAETLASRIDRELFEPRRRWARALELTPAR